MINTDKLKIQCNCHHEFQDKQYGKGIRVATPVEKTRFQGKLKEVRCTVCAKTHLLN